MNNNNFTESQFVNVHRKSETLLKANNLPELLKTLQLICTNIKEFLKFDFKKTIES